MPPSLVWLVWCLGTWFPKFAHYQALATPQVGAASCGKQILGDDSRLKLKGKCESCKLDFPKHRVKRLAGKDDILLTDKFCKPCWQRKNNKRRGAGRYGQAQNIEVSGVTKSEQSPYLSAVEAKEDSSMPEQQSELLALGNGGYAVPLPHYIFDKAGGWRQSQVKPHPVVKFTVSIDKSDYEHLRLPCPKMRPTTCSAVDTSGHRMSVNSSWIEGVQSFWSQEILPGTCKGRFECD